MGRSGDWPQGIYVAAGFSGHGFMMGPFTGELMAKHIVTGDVDPLMEPFLPSRFTLGKALRETMVI
jgi:sarcosine oxidase subunit beta